LREHGYAACVVERYVAQARLKQDAFHCGDILAAHPTERIVALIQTTTSSHLNARRLKASVQPELPSWLKAGGRFFLHGWGKRKGKWDVRVVELTEPDCSAPDVGDPPPPVDFLNPEPEEEQEPEILREDPPWDQARADRIITATWPLLESRWSVTTDANNLAELQRLAEQITVTYQQQATCDFAMAVTDLVAFCRTGGE
jgi:hypothetical protein